MTHPGSYYNPAIDDDDEFVYDDDDSTNNGLDEHSDDDDDDDDDNNVDHHNYQGGRYLRIGPESIIDLAHHSYYFTIPQF